MDFVELWEQMGLSVRLLMGILAVMSMWSVGVFFERLFTYNQASKQSKDFAPQVAKHLKDNKLELLKILLYQMKLQLNTIQSQLDI